MMMIRCRTTAAGRPIKAAWFFETGDEYFTYDRHSWCSDSFHTAPHRLFCMLCGWQQHINEVRRQNCGSSPTYGAVRQSGRGAWQWLDGRPPGQEGDMTFSHLMRAMVDSRACDGAPACK